MHDLVRSAVHGLKIEVAHTVITRDLNGVMQCIFSLLGQVCTLLLCPALPEFKVVHLRCTRVLFFISYSIYLTLFRPNG